MLILIKFVKIDLDIYKCLQMGRSNIMQNIIFNIYIGDQGEKPKIDERLYRRFFNKVRIVKVKNYFEATSPFNENAKSKLENLADLPLINIYRSSLIAFFYYDWNNVEEVWKGILFLINKKIEQLKNESIRLIIILRGRGFGADLCYELALLLDNDLKSKVRLNKFEPEIFINTYEPFRCKKRFSSNQKSHMESMSGKQKQYRYSDLVKTVTCAANKYTQMKTFGTKYFTKKKVCSLDEYFSDKKFDNKTIQTIFYCDSINDEIFSRFEILFMEEFRLRYNITNSKQISYQAKKPSEDVYIKYITSIGKPNTRNNGYPVNVSLFLDSTLSKYRNLVFGLRIAFGLKFVKSVYFYK